MSKQIDKYSYNPNDLLGIGTIGRVVKAVDAKKNQYALRIIKKEIITDDEGMQSALLDEIRLMQKLNHPKIVQLIEVIQSDNNYYVVMELCKQDLFSYLQQLHKMPESECLKLLIDLLEGFTELIKHGVIHRGLKLSNVMLRDGSYKLADCGFSKCIENFKKDQSRKDEDFKFHSPQLLANTKYTNKCDIWSLGMILYNALYGYTAWSGTKIEQLQHNIEHKLLEFPDEQTSVSSDMKSFIEGCLAIEETERMNWDDVFKHKLVKEHFKNYQTHIKEEQVKFLMNELRQKIIKQNIDIRKLFQELDENGDNTLQFSELVVLLHKIDKTLSRQDCQIIFKQLDLDGDKTVSFEEFAKWLTDNNTKMTLLTGKFKNKAKTSTKNIPSLQQIPQQWPKQNDDPFGNQPMQQSIRVQQGQPNLTETVQMQSMDPQKTILKLKQAISKFNINIHDLFVKFDFDCDGLLNFQEFSQLFMKVNRYAQQFELQTIFQNFDVNCDGFVSFIEFRQVLNLTQEPIGTIAQSVYQMNPQQMMMGGQQYQSQQRLPTYPTMI